MPSPFDNKTPDVIVLVLASPFLILFEFQIETTTLTPSYFRGNFYKFSCVQSHKCLFGIWCSVWFKIHKQPGKILCRLESRSFELQNRPSTCVWIQSNKIISDIVTPRFHETLFQDLIAYWNKTQETGPAYRPNWAFIYLYCVPRFNLIWLNNPLPLGSLWKLNFTSHHIQKQT